MTTKTPEYLIPPSDPEKLKIYQSIPDNDKAAWNYFTISNRESVNTKPAYTWDEFVEGYAGHMHGLIPILDSVVGGDGNNKPLIRNYREPLMEGELVVDPMLGSLEAIWPKIEKQLESSNVALLCNHPTLATPYLVARALIDAAGEEIASRIHIILGPYPTVMEFELGGMAIKPVLLGRALSNLILTGPDTDSVRSKGNEELVAWLKIQRRHFWNNLNSLLSEDNEQNSILIICPAGRRMSGSREYRVDGTYDYLTGHNKNGARRLAVLPVGVFDRLLTSQTDPSSYVRIKPDDSLWFPQDDRNALFLHERSCHYATSPLGYVEMETREEQLARLLRQKVIGRKLVERSLAPLSMSE